MPFQKLFWNFQAIIFFLFVIFEREILQIYVIAFYRPILTKAGEKERKPAKGKGQKKKKFAGKGRNKGKNTIKREREREGGRK